MNEIFVSYRRSDSSAVSGRIYDRLQSKFGPDRVFKDVDSIPLGADFRHSIGTALTDCKVVLAVIGPSWLSVRENDGTRRLDLANDHVRVELVTAISKEIPVIPILVEHATIPKECELPADLVPLVFRNGISVRHDPDFNNDVSRLMTHVAALLEQTVPPRKPTSKSQPERPAGRQDGSRQMQSCVSSGLSFLIGMGCIYFVYLWLTTPSSDTDKKTSSTVLSQNGGADASFPNAQNNSPARTTNGPPSKKATPAPSDSTKMDSPKVSRSTQPAREPVSIAPDGATDVVKAMQLSIRTAQIKEFTVDQVFDWSAQEDEIVDGETYKTGIVSYKAETIFGVKIIQAKALIKGTKVQRWIWPKSGMEIK